MNIRAIARHPIRFLGSLAKKGNETAAVKGRLFPRIIGATLLVGTIFGLAGGTHRAARHVGDPEISAFCEGMKCWLDIKAGLKANFLMEPPKLQLKKEGCGLRSSNLKVIDEGSAQAVLDRSQVTGPCDVRVIIGGKPFTYWDIQF